MVRIMLDWEYYEEASRRASICRPEDFQRSSHRLFLPHRRHLSCPRSLQLLPQRSSRTLRRVTADHSFINYITRTTTTGPKKRSPNLHLRFRSQSGRSLLCYLFGSLRNAFTTVTHGEVLYNDWETWGAIRIPLA